MWLVHYDFQQCIMLHIALGNNVATGYNNNNYADIAIIATRINAHAQ